MKNSNTIHEQATTNREAFFAHRRALTAARDTLEALYRERNEDNTPAQTIAAYVAAVGYPVALEVIGSMVNRSAWDGRIYPAVKEWAQNLPEAWDEEAAQRLELYTSIHMAHLNQLAQALMKYTPAEETEAAEIGTNTEKKEEEATMYPNLKKNAAEEINSYCEKAVAAITTGESALERNSTATRWGQYKAGKITKEQAEQYAVARTRKEYARKLEKKLSRLDQIAAAPEVKSVSVSVSWYHNRYWGWNPTAEVEIETTGGVFRESGHASGCGYDKQSAAVGEALNKCAAVLRMLCDKKESALEGATAVEYSNRNYIAYGAGYGAIPYFEGGVGMSSFESVFNACGFKLRHFHETKTTNYYYFEKEAA